MDTEYEDANHFKQQVGKVYEYEVQHVDTKKLNKYKAIPDIGNIGAKSKTTVSFSVSLNLLNSKRGKRYTQMKTVIAYDCQRPTCHVDHK